LVQRPSQLLGQLPPHVVVVVVVVGVVVVETGQLGPPAGDAQASQQLRQGPTRPFRLAHAAALFAIEQRVPFEPVTQQVTAPGLPHVDFEAHFLTAPLHFAGRRPAATRAFTTCSTQRTQAA
jgi:hypothetical protein